MPSAFETFCEKEIEQFEHTVEWLYRARAWFDGIQYQADQRAKKQGTKGRRIPLQLVAYGTDFSGFDGTKRDLYNLVFHMIHDQPEYEHQGYLTATFRCPDGALVTLAHDDVQCDCARDDDGICGENVFCCHQHMVLAAIDLELSSIRSMGSEWADGSTNCLIMESMEEVIELWHRTGQGMKSVKRGLVQFAKELVGPEEYKRDRFDWM